MRGRESNAGHNWQVSRAWQQELLYCSGEYGFSLHKEDHGSQNPSPPKFRILELLKEVKVEARLRLQLRNE